MSRPKLTPEQLAALDKALAATIATPTPYLHPQGWQQGRNRLYLSPLERAEIILRVEEVLEDPR